MTASLRPTLQALASALTAVVALALTGACGGPRTNLDRPLGPPPGPPVVVTTDWQVDLVDNGFFSYSPTELARIGVHPNHRLVYVGLSDGRFVAIDVTGGTVVWERYFDEPIDSQPVADRTLVYVGGSDGFMYALDAAGGGERWRYETGGSLDSTPALSDGALVFANPEGVIVCLTAATGELRWTASDEDRALTIRRGLHPAVKGQASPLIHNGRVYVGYPSGYLTALELETGRPLWSTDLANEQRRHVDVDEQPTWVDGRLYASSFNGGFFAIDPQTGRPLWRRDLRGATRAAAWGQSLLTSTVDGRVHSVDMRTGLDNFSLELEARAPGVVHLMGDYVVVATTQGALYVLDAGTPHIHVRYRPGAGFASVAPLPGGRLVALDNHGILHGLTLHREGT